MNPSKSSHRRKLEFVRDWYERVREGLPVLGRPDATAREARGAEAEPGEQAAHRLVRRYTALSGAAGFVCGLPGYVSMPVTVPVNVAGVLLLQLHMAQALAIFYGRDPTDDEVKDGCIREILGAGRPPAGAREGEDGDGLLRRTLSKLGERGIRFAGEQAYRVMGRGTRSLPLLGGVVGGVHDARSTADVGRGLRDVFRSG